MTANALTPTGRTTLVAISRPSTSQAWGVAKPVIEQLHCFASLKESAPKHIFTKAAGEKNHMGRVNAGLTAEFELHGDSGYSGLKSLLAAFFSDVTAPAVVDANKVWKNTYTLPLSPNTVFTLCTYDGVGRIQEIPTCMATTLTIEAKSESMWTWHIKGHGDQLREQGACYNTADDVTLAVYASNSYFQKYVAHDASQDSIVGAYRGKTRLMRVTGSEGAFGTAQEIPWSDLKVTIDLKANAIGINRRSKAFPAITDIPEVKYEITVPTESGNVDTQGVWAGMISDAFDEGANRGPAEQLPYDYKLYVDLVGPLAGGSATAAFELILESPRLAARCTNPTAANSGLEQVKLELMGMQALTAPTGIQGVQPIYVTYQTDHTDPAVPTPATFPAITSGAGEPDAMDTVVNGTYGGGGTPNIYIYAYHPATGKTSLIGQGVGAAGAFAVTVSALLSGDILTAYQDNNEKKTLPSVPVTVT